MLANVYGIIISMREMHGSSKAGSYDSPTPCHYTGRSSRIAPCHTLESSRCLTKRPLDEQIKRFHTRHGALQIVRLALICIVELPRSEGHRRGPGNILTQDPEIRGIRQVV